MSKGVRPFANHSEYEYWRDRNCDQCVLNGYERGGKVCQMEEAISLGSISGTVPASLAQEFGATIRGEYADMPKQCSHFLR